LNPPSGEAESAKRRMMFVMLAGVLAIVGTLAGGLYFANAAGELEDRGRSRQQR